jgi:hypothetical protein
MDDFFVLLLAAFKHFGKILQIVYIRTTCIQNFIILIHFFINDLGPTLSIRFNLFHGIFNALHNFRSLLTIFSHLKFESFPSIFNVVNFFGELLNRLDKKVTYNNFSSFDLIIFSWFILSSSICP